MTNEQENRMSDLVSRTNAIEKCKAEFLNTDVQRETESQTLADQSYARGWNACNRHWMNELLQLPSAQPEIIYCEDCKYYMPQREHTGLCTWFSDVLKYGVGYNDYCSNAEKDGDTDDV